MSAPIGDSLYDAECFEITPNLEDRIKALSPAEQEAVKLFWRSVVMRSQRAFSEENGRLPPCTADAAAVAGVRSCNCCPYGYHIDLDFVRYCEALANAKPSEEELRRRSRRRSRKSMEFMLGFESLFDQWDAAERVQAVPEASQESEPDSPRAVCVTSTPYSQQQQPARPRSASVPRYTYGSLTRAESPFGTASSTCSSLRGGVESDAYAHSHAPFPMRQPTNSPPETRAFLHDALDEVCSDFERTLERASMKRKKGGATGGSGGGGGGMSFVVSSDRNNNSTLYNGTGGGGGGGEKRNYYSWDRQYDTLDSCVTGNKSPRSSRSFSKSYTLPFRQQPSPAEQQYESYVQATVAANAKSPVEQLLTPPPPPPRRHATIRSPTPGSPEDEAKVVPGGGKSAEVAAAGVALLSPTNDAAAAAADAQTLFNIRQQMALSLKRMKDLEEQVRGIPEMQHELTALRDEKQRLQHTLQLKSEELQKARETARFSSSPSPVASPKFASPVQQFTPQRISPIALESLGARLRTNSTSSESQLKTSLVLKRDVATMCGLHATRDIAVGSPSVTLRTIGTSPAQAVSLSELLYTQQQMEQRVQKALSAHETQHLHKQQLQQKRLISVGTQMYVPKRDVRDSGAQTAAEKPTLKFAVGVMAKPTTCESFVSCKPDVRTVGVSEDSVTDLLCEKCAVVKRTIACGTEELAAETTVEAKATSLSLKLLDMPGRSNTFSLGDNEKLQLKRKTIGTQYTPVVVHSAGSQTPAAAAKHTVAVQYSPELRAVGTQSHVDSMSRQTDTRGLIRLCATQTSTEEIATPKPAPLPVPAAVAPAKPAMRSTSSNTDAPKTTDHGVNTAAPARTRHSASNTDAVHKRDAACGDVVKPHISIACADNYCDSCKDAIKHLAKDFSKVLASPLPTRAADSKIPRPKHLTSPSPVRKQFQRQNTYTITPSPTPSPVTEKKSLISSLQEKPPSIASFQQLDSSGESQSFITEPTSGHKAVIVTGTRRPSNSSQRAEELEAVFSRETPKGFEPTHIGDDDLIVREEKRVSISWSRDASPAPPLLKDGQPLKSLDSSFHEQIVESVEPLDALASDVSKGARRKTPSPLKSSQTEGNAPPKVHDDMQQQRPPSKALLQKLAMVEAEPRQKVSPSKEMQSALKIINGSLLKKMGAKALSSASLKTSKTAIQLEWFRISSTDNANPHEVEDYVDCFEELSVPLLEYCVNMVDANGNTAMHYAVSHGNFDVVSILLDSKVCNVNQMNNAGYTSVMLVSLAKLKNAAHRTVVERLFQMADVNIRAKKHCQTALMLAVSHGNLDMVEMLLGAGADINIQDEDGSTALMCAAEHGRVDIVKHLLTQSECNSLVQDIDGSTAFKIAWQAGHRDVGLLLYVHEQMLRSKMPNRGAEQRTPTLSPRQHKRQPSK